ncbi:hypothetical protein A3F28_03690 [Candidatus Uhrbacteria bacterium RIFCSPHIGHO2_12_FULL_57_11]|uniref:Uncharacterized protein n=1 Tax=Candidatus Uhrbacteria bacterium RIFCSPHIGHO2_12_FULL_57_11 TaxID=1802398 RepID=A0A1F7UMA6_9BACT|nr:MAG: hypothetical protein A3F28_03690 [Candidatus Uhrbacteria bacterium RIFCSPHIGHO2_12_FULL_57_11]
MTNPARQPAPNHPPGSFVEVYRIGRGTEKTLLARCVLQQDGTARCVGDANFIRELTTGITLVYPTPRSFLPADGLAFLQALQSAYQSAYINATDIQPPSAGEQAASTGTVSSNR